MQALSTTDHAQTLLEREVASPRVRGALSPASEAASVFESIALTMLLNPRTSLWFAFLAKNGLQKVVQDELAAIAVLRQDISDLSNVSLDLQDTRYLNDARNALIQLEQLDRVSTDSAQYRKFDTAVNNFLNRTVGKGVRRPGVSGLIRPGTEAASALVEDFMAIVGLHQDFTSRFYGLLVGVDNFLTSPFSTILGLRTTSRARTDIDNLLASISEKGRVKINRDMVTRMITNRAAIRTTTALTSLDAPVLDTAQGLPVGFNVKAATDPSPPTTTSLEGPFTFSVGASMSVTSGGTTLGPFSFPQSTTDLHNKACIVSAAVSYPVTFPADYNLFMNINNVPFMIGPFTAGSRTLAATLSVLNAAFAAHSSATVQALHAAEYVTAGTSRIIIYHDTASALSISDLFMDETFGLFSDSIHETLGFTGTEFEVSGATTAQFVVDAINALFPGIVSATLQDPNQVLVEALDTSPGASLVVTAPPELGISGTIRAQVTSLRLYGTVNGVPTDPINPIGLVDIEDEVTTSSGISKIAEVTDTRIILADSLSAFDGEIRVDSVLVQTYRSLETLLSSFSALWFKSPFTENLDKLSIALSSLAAGAVQSQKNIILSLLDSLQSLLESFLASLNSPAAFLPPGAASAEKSIVDGITNTLTERKFDRALALFMRCNIQEALSCNAETASFGGAFLNAASTFATTDLVIPNRAIGEGVEGTSSQPTKGL